MNAAAAAFVLAPALALGSFLNVVVARVPARSRSSARRPRAAAADRRSCGATTSRSSRMRCCAAAAGTATRASRRSTRSSRGSQLLLVVACFAVFGATLEAVLASAFCAVLVVLSAIDLQHRIVPNRIVLPAAAVTLAAHTLLDPSLEWLLGALGASGFLFVAALAYPKGLGLGDVKLALLLGAMLGASVSVALFLGFVAALVPSAVLFARHGSAARKMAIPLVPFLSLGSVVALFGGEWLLDGYLALF